MNKNFVCAAILLAGLLPLACYRNVKPQDQGETPAAQVHATPTWSVSTCAQYQNVTVGSYVVETDFWNQGSCPGTQCMLIDGLSGAFSVTQAPKCGNTVASYPNVLYGCSWGTCSPGSVLPKPVSLLSTVTSSWSFSVGGAAGDMYNVAYDIWFCPDNTCGTNGFPNGTELMIWLNYQNVNGWKNDVGSVSLSGHTWELWQSPAESGKSTYLAYLVQAPMLTSITNFDLMAFVQDALTRGYIQKSWYLYAIQAGDELRTGGLPYNNNSFSVSMR